MVGDSVGDIEAGENVGCRTILLAGSGYIKKQTVSPDFSAKNISDMIKFIEK